MPDDYYMVDYTLLTTEIIDRNIEEDFWKNNKEKGELRKWPINGITVLDIQRGCSAAGIFPVIYSFY